MKQLRHQFARTKDKIDEKKPSHWKLLGDFRKRLANSKSAAPKVANKSGGPERKLLENDYFCLFLFGLLNPVVDSLPRRFFRESPAVQDVYLNQ